MLRTPHAVNVNNQLLMVFLQCYYRNLSIKLLMQIKSITMKFDYLSNNYLLLFIDSVLFQSYCNMN